MRITFEADDLQAIADVVVRKLSPLLEKVLEAAQRPASNAAKHIPVNEQEVIRSIKTTGEVIRKKNCAKLLDYH